MKRTLCETVRVRANWELFKPKGQKWEAKKKGKTAEDPPKGGLYRKNANLRGDKTQRH